MNSDEKKLVGRTIVKAEVNGYEVTLTLDDGTIFHYDASDGGMSFYEFRKEGGDHA